MIVVDASAVLDMLLQAESAEHIATIVLAPTQRLHAPHVLDVEVAQVLRRLVLHKEITAARAQLALQDFSSLVIDRHSHLPMLSRIFELRDSVTAYDGAYIALAEALNAPLMTSDGRLARSHGHRARVTFAGVR